jgi:hypothetical protein
VVRRLVLLALLPVIAVLVAGCGGGDGSANEGDADALLRETFNAQKSVRSGRLDLRMDVDARGVEGLGGPLAIHLTGPFDNGAEGAIPKFDFDLDLRAGGTRLRAGTVSDGRKGYLRLQGRAYTLTDELFKQLAPRRKGGDRGGAAGPTLSGLGVDPRRWLRDPHTEGEEQVGGAATVHIAGDIDVSRFLGDLDKLLGRTGGLGLPGAGAAGRLTETQRELLSKSIESAKADIWTGKQDKAMRRFSVLVRFDPAKGKDAKGRAGTLRFDLTVADLNRRQAIGPPADPRPLSELTAALALLVSRQAKPAAGDGAGASGGAGSGASSGAGASSAGASGGAAASDGSNAAGAATGRTATSRYDACLAAAGTDLAKVQRCAALLGQ